MIKPRTIFHWVGWMSVAAFVLFLLYVTVIIPSGEQWKVSHEITSQFADAKSVTFSEFTPYYYDQNIDQIIHREVVLQERAATPQQVKDFCAAVGDYVAFSDGSISIAGCFNPHHRVDVVHRDGSKSRMEICFECRKYRLGHEFEQVMPAAWLAHLSVFFTRLGMPPRKEGELYGSCTGQDETLIGPASGTLLLWNNPDNPLAIYPNAGTIRPEWTVCPSPLKY